MLDIELDTFSKHLRRRQPMIPCRTLPRANMSFRLQHLFVLSLLGLSLALAGCGQERHSPLDVTTMLVPVANGDTVTVVSRYYSVAPSRQRPGSQMGRGRFWERYSIEIQSAPERIITWEGESSPRVLRRVNGRLYKVTYDRSSGGWEFDRFRFYQEVGSELIEINRDLFPKEAAVQNIGFNPHPFGCCDKWGFTDREVTEALNPDDPCFASRLTATLWMCLELEIEYYESQKRGVDINVLKEFKRKYMPYVPRSVLVDLRGEGKVIEHSVRGSGEDRDP